MVNDIIEELSILDLEPKPQSLSWTNTHKGEDERTLNVWGQGKNWTCRSWTRFKSWAIAFERLGNTFKARTRQSEKGWEVGGGVVTSTVRRASLRKKFDSVASHVFRTAQNGGVNWLWSLERVVRAKRWESKILRQTLRPRMVAGEDWVNYTKRTSKELRAKWTKMKLSTMAQEYRNNLEDHGLGQLHLGRPSSESATLQRHSCLITHKLLASRLLRRPRSSVVQVWSQALLAQGT